MTKRRKALLIIAAIFLAVCLAAASFFAYIAIKGYGFTLGRFYSDESATYIISDSVKAKLNDRSKKHKLFTSLSNGDLILVINDGIEETYPAQTGAYALLKLKDGSEDDIDEKLKTNEIVKTDTRTVSLSHGFANISLEVFENWTAKTDDKKIDSEDERMSITLYPNGHDEGKISIVFLGEGFGYCGTGIESKKIKLGKYDAYQNKYYEDSHWSFIELSDVAGTYIIYAEGIDNWWDTFGNEAMEILSTIKVADGYITASKATELAKEICSVEYKEAHPYFNFKDGIWEVKFINGSETKELITVSADGKTVSSNENPQNSTKTFLAKVLDIQNKSQIAVVEPFQNETEYKSASKISFSYKDLGDEKIFEGDCVEIKYNGEIAETYPATISPLSWEKKTDLRDVIYSGQWLKTKEETDGEYFSDIVITEIYSNCFFAQKAYPLPYTMKINGTLSDRFCVGDQLTAICKNTFIDEENQRVEGDLISTKESDFVLNPNAAYKPVIYLYPEEETAVEVALNLKGKLTCTYPKYDNSWKVIASPDGTLKDENGQIYNYLYWEGEIANKWDTTRGFCVKGEDTAAFLENALEKLGLNRKEANEFIVYWLPLMEKNEYNIISFQTSAYTDAATLSVSPSPDSVIRVFMTWKRSETFVDIPTQKLSAPVRQGFTVVEWGGTEIK